MPIAVAVILGALAGVALGHAFDALAGAVVAWLLVRSVQQGRVITELQATLKGLRETPQMAIEPVAVPDTAQARGAADAGPAASAQPPADAATADDWLAMHAAPVEPSQPPQPTEPLALPELPAQPAAPRPHPLEPLRAWLFGGNTIVKAGIGILFVGLAFLAKFASERTHVPVELRLAGIAAVAIVLLVIGWRLRLRRAGYAQVLQGGAVAVLYLTLFVAFRFYGVLAVGPVFAMLVVVAALAAALAVLQNARALAVVAALGGFAAPLLISTGSGGHVALFAYYLVLDVGIAAVAWHRTWRSLNLIGFVGTFVVATGWGVLKYRPEQYASGQAFLIAFFLLFAAILLMPQRASTESDTPQPHRSDGWVQGSLLFGLPTISFVLQYGLVRDTDYGTALSALLLAGFYVAMASWMRSRPRLALHFEASLAIGTVFLTLVIPFALDARSTAGAWALEGTGLVWLGLRQARGLPRVFGYALLLLAGGAMVYARDRHGIPSTFFNAYFFNALMAAAASLAAALFVKRMVNPSAASPHSPASQEDLAEPLLIGWGTLWLLAAAALQIDHFVAGPMQLSAWIAAVGMVAVLYTLLSVRLDWPRITAPLMAYAPLLMLGALASAVRLSGPFDHGGWWAWPLALAAHLLILRRLAPWWPDLARDLAHALGVLVLALLGALQGRATTADWGDAASAWPWLGWLVVPAVLLLLLPRAASARHWPVSAAQDAYQWLASLWLAALLLLWTVVANLASNGSAAPLVHVPLLNPLDIGVGIALFAGVSWYRTVADRPELRATPHIPVAALGVAGFVWINAMLIRGFHHYGGVPFNVDAWSHSLAVQTGLTLLWTASALVLMWLSARKHLRPPWMVGAALLALVVLKLFVVDLSGSGTVTRIVSFIGVGALMLVIGYVAPLPGKRDQDVAH